MNKTLLLVFLPLFICCAGCETLYQAGGRYDQNNAAVRAEMARQNVARNAEIARATAQSSEARLQQLDMRIARLEASVNGRDNNLSSEMVVLRNEIAAARADIAAEKASREKMHDEIVSQLSNDIASLLRRQQKQLTAAAAVEAVAASSQTGYNHKVQSGQTLSEIAHAYNVSVDKIRKENHLKSDVIRVGQVLFIPEVK